MSEDRREQGKPQPAPAVGQVWRGRLRYQKDEVPYEVLEVGAVSATIRQDGHESTGGIMLEDLARWSCIGISTPAGRVMVGERRRSPGGADRIVSRVMGEAMVWMGWPGRVLDDSCGGMWPAEEVAASWLLSPAPAPAAKSPVPANPWNCSPNIVDRHCPMGHGFAVVEGGGNGYEAYGRIIKEATHAMAMAILGPREGARLDPREQGPGLASWGPPERPGVGPDLIHCERWERWCSP